MTKEENSPKSLKTIAAKCKNTRHTGVLKLSPKLSKVTLQNSNQGLRIVKKIYGYIYAD